MDCAKTIVEVRSWVGARRCGGQSIGFVPSMGALHEGHRSLIEAARAQCDCVVVGIFVNPTQFGPNEDYRGYPRPVEDDLAVCDDAGVDLVFMPGVEEMYPQPGLTAVHISDLAEGLCGAFRPGHFDSVATVVTKLFHIVGPDRAYFGEKDFQQLRIIQRMVKDLNLPVEIVACPTVRESDGLAVSSRNRYLTDAQRRQATALYRSMREAAEAVAAGEVEVARLIAEIEDNLKQSGPCTVDYVKIVDPMTLRELDRVEGWARICVAVRIGRCRLIDNLEVDAAAGRR